MIAVVGAGITGLALGLELAAREADFVLLEADDRPGGVIRSTRVDGRVLDRGPQRLRLAGRVSRLIEDLGLADELILAPSGLDLWIYRAGRLRAVPFSPARFLTSDVAGPGGKLRLLLEPLTRGADPDERVADYFRRKVGDELYEALVAPLFGGLYGSDPADMEVGTSLAPLLRELGVERSLLWPLLKRGGRIDPPAACSFRGGMESLPAAMGAALGDRLRLEARVLHLVPAGSGWRLRLPDGTLDADTVVITTPAPVAADLLRDAAPRAAAAVERLRYNPLAVVHLEAETGLRGLGFQVALSERERVLRGVTFNDSLFGRANLYTAYLGGARNPEVDAWDDRRLAAAAAREFEHCTGYAAAVLRVERARMPAWDVSWRGLRDLALPKGIRLAASWWSRPGVPGRLAEAARVAGELNGRPGGRPGAAQRGGASGRSR